MIGIRIEGEEIWLEPAEWERWVQDGRVPPQTPVLMGNDRWMPAERLQAYQDLLRAPVTLPRKSRPLIGAVLFPGKNLSATEALILANIVIGGALSLAWGQGYPHEMREWAADRWHEVHEDRAYWWWLTTIFLHGGAGHLFRNMISLLAGAGAVEFLMGKRWAYAVYFITGVAGMLLSYVGHARPPLSIGASGAVFGLVGCTVGFIVRRYSMFSYRQKWKARRIYLPLFLALFLPSLLHADYFGHLGGLLSGVLLGFLIPPHQRIRELAAAEDTMAESTESRP